MASAAATELPVAACGDWAPGDGGFRARPASRRAEWRVSGGRGRAAPPQAPEASGVSARRLLQRGVGRGPRP